MKPTLARIKAPRSHAQGWPVYAEKNIRKVKRLPTIVKIQRRVFFMGSRSERTPRMGEVRATVRVDRTMARLQRELPVKVRPRTVASSPRDSLKRKTK